MKRPKFEEMNYPEPKNGWWNWIVITVVVVVVAGLAYVGAHYWYQCSDWGIIKFCSVVQKP